MICWQQTCPARTPPDHNAASDCTCVASPRLVGRVFCNARGPLTVTHTSEFDAASALMPMARPPRCCPSPLRAMRCRRLDLRFSLPPTHRWTNALNTSSQDWCLQFVLPRSWSTQSVNLMCVSTPSKLWLKVLFRHAPVYMKESRRSKLKRGIVSRAIADFLKQGGRFLKRSGNKFAVVTHTSEQLLRSPSIVSLLRRNRTPAIPLRLSLTTALLLAAEQLNEEWLLGGRKILRSCRRRGQA